jgi:hypothetical protein
MDGRQLGNTPPKYSFSKVISTLGSKGLMGALDDPEHGPHVHLTLLLSTILVVTGLIIIGTLIFM